MPHLPKSPDFISADEYLFDDLKVIESLRSITSEGVQPVYSGDSRCYETAPDVLRLAKAFPTGADLSAFITQMYNKVQELGTFNPAAPSIPIVDCAKSGGFKSLFAVKYLIHKGLLLSGPAVDDRRRHMVSVESIDVLLAQINAGPLPPPSQEPQAQLPYPDGTAPINRFPGVLLRELVALRCIPAATMICARRREFVLPIQQAERIAAAFPTVESLEAFSAHLYDRQRKYVARPDFSVRITDLHQFGRSDTSQHQHDEDIRFLITRKLLVAAPNPDDRRHLLVSSKSINNLLALIQAGPIQQLCGGNHEN